MQFGAERLQACFVVQTRCSMQNAKPFGKYWETDPFFGIVKLFQLLLHMFTIWPFEIDNTFCIVRWFELSSVMYVCKQPLQNSIAEALKTLAHEMNCSIGG